MANIFSTAKTKSVDKKTKTNDRPVIKIKGDDFDTNLKAFVNLKSESDRIKTRLELTLNFIKSIALDNYCNIYRKNKSNPGTIEIQSDSNDSFLLAPNDKYITVNKERADELKGKYGDDIVTETTKYAFNPDLLEKYADILSDLIQNCSDIDDDDKDNLIVAENAFTVAKGSIDRALTLGKDVKEFIDDIQPIFQVKSAKLND